MKKLGKAWLKRMAVHWAVHIAFWPTRVEWTDKEGTQQLVDLGVDVLKVVLDNDMKKLLESPLLRDVQEALVSIMARE